MKDAAQTPILNQSATTVSTLKFSFRGGLPYRVARGYHANYAALVAGEFSGSFVARQRMSLSSSTP